MKRRSFFVSAAAIFSSSSLPEVKGSLPVPTRATLAIHHPIIAVPRSLRVRWTLDTDSVSGETLRPPRSFTADQHDH